MLLTAIGGWIGIIIQLILMLEANPEKTIAEKTINFFSYFTILSNILIAFSLTIIATKPGSKAGRFFSNPSVQSALAVYIIMVMTMYILFLKETWNPQGWQWIADVKLHYLIPILYIVYWIIFVPKGQTHWMNSIVWLIYPLCYLVYTLIRGAISGFYPYPFIDVHKLGYTHSLLNAFKIMIGFIGIGLLIIAVDKLMKKKEWKFLKQDPA
ncbi:MAG TPA: Pr6Pr family membrane protein [Puia sp.]|nr:Pr6Pr family membrane protein [Puia sp.]